MWGLVINRIYKRKRLNQPDLTAIRTYFMRWLIRMTLLVQINSIFAKSYVFYELTIHLNLYEWPTANSAPKPHRHWV